MPRLQQPHLAMPSLSQSPSAPAAQDPPAGESSAGAVSAQGVHDPLVTFSSAGLNFEQNNSAVPAPLTLSGQLVGKQHSYRLSLWTPGADIKFTVPRVENSSEANKAPDIPMSWELRYRSGEEWGPWQPASTDQAGGLPPGACWWLLPVAGGPCAFELRCSVQPQPSQPPGQYQRSLTVNVSGCDAPGGAR